jgi:hypothetical protein
LRYLALVSDALAEDRPLRPFLAIFSLLHEQAEDLSAFLASRLSGPAIPERTRQACEMIRQSLDSVNRRVFERELPSVAAQMDPSVIYTRMENGHGLLRHGCQNAIAILVQSLDERIEARMLFPAMAEGIQQGQRLRADLWELRHDLIREIEKATGLDLNCVLERIARFRETSLRFLMYQDWGEFERCSESLITAANDVDARALLRKFVGFLETLLQEVAKRNVLQ